MQSESVGEQSRTATLQYSLLKLNNLDASCSDVVDSMYWCQCCSCCVILFVPFGLLVHGQTPWKYSWCKDGGGLVVY